MNHQLDFFMKKTAAILKRENIVSHQSPRGIRQRRIGNVKGNVSLFISLFLHHTAEKTGGSQIMIQLKRGDADVLEISLKWRGIPITEENLEQLEKVEFLFGGNRKLWKRSGGTVPFTDGKFRYSYSQQESFALHPGTVMLEIRAKAADQSVKGTQIRIPVRVVDTLSREVL